MEQKHHEGRRRRRVRRSKKRPIPALLAVAAAVLIGAGIFFFGPEEAPEETTPSTTAPVETAGETNTGRRQDTVIKICVAGDLNVTDYLLQQAQGALGCDFTNTFLDVAPILGGADLTLLNFEGNLSSGEYGTETGVAPLELAQALKAVGVDVVQTANSASVRQGIAGLTRTLEEFRKVGLTPLGTYATAAEFRKSGGYAIAEVQGIRIALVAFTKGMDNLGLPAGSEDCVNLLYKDYSTSYKEVDTEGIAKILRNVAQEQPDITIAMVHWGSEYNEEISKSQGKIRDQLLNAGVDIIVGSHPHLVQTIDYDPIKQTVVAYSLGDFLGDGVMAGTNYSVLLNLEVTRVNSTGETYLSGCTYTPIYTLKPEESVAGGHRVVRIREAMERFDANFVGGITEQTYNAMANALGRIEDRVTPKKSDS